MIAPTVRSRIWVDINQPGGTEQKSLQLRQFSQLITIQRDVQPLQYSIPPEKLPENVAELRDHSKKRILHSYDLPPANVSRAKYKLSNTTRPIKASIKAAPSDLHPPCRSLISTTIVYNYSQMPQNNIWHIKNVSLRERNRVTYLKDALQGDHHLNW